MKEKRKPNLFPVYNSKQNLCFLLIKNPLFQGYLIRNYFMQHLFIVGKFFDKL